MKNLLNEIVFNVKRSKNIIIIGCFLFVVGLVLGLVVAIQEQIFEIFNDNLFSYYNKIFCGEKVGMSLLISRCINALLILVLVALFSLNRYIFYLNFIILFYRAFTLGVLCKIFVTQIIVTGAIMFVFLILIQALFLAVSILLFMIIIYKKNNKCNDVLISLIIKSFILSSIVALFGCLIEFLLIIMFFRPLNLIF